MKEKEISKRTKSMNPFGKYLLRYGVGVLIMGGVIALWYGFENFSGYSVWKSYVCEANGWIEDSIDSKDFLSSEPRSRNYIWMKDLIPPPMDSNKNFASHPYWQTYFKSIYGDREEERDTLKQKHEMYCPLTLSLKNVSQQEWKNITVNIEKEIDQLFLYKDTNLTKEELIWNGGASSLVGLCEKLLNMQKEGEVAHFSLRDYLQRHPECRYPVDWKMVALSGERNVHSSAFLHLEDYSYHRAIALAITKEAEECAKEAIYLIKLGNSLSREPSDISLLLKQKLIDSGLKVIYLGLNLGLWEESQLSELQKELEKVDFWDDYRLGMMGERATINEYALNVGVKTYAFLKDVNISTIQEKDVLKYFPENWFERLKLHLRPKGWFFRDLLEYNYMMDTLIEIQDREDRKFNSLETPFALQNLEDYLMEWKNKSFRTKNLICNDKLASFYWKIIIELPWRQFDKDATAASCAVERYYLREGRYPKSISDLKEICPLIDNNDKVNFIPLNIEFTEDEYCFVNPGWTRMPVGKEMENKALGIWRWKMQKKGVFADKRQCEKMGEESGF